MFEAHHFLSFTIVPTTLVGSLRGPLHLISLFFSVNFPVLSFLVDPSPLTKLCLDLISDLSLCTCSYRSKINEYH